MYSQNYFCLKCYQTNSCKCLERNGIINIGIRTRPPKKFTKNKWKKYLENTNYEFLNYIPNDKLDLAIKMFSQLNIDIRKYFDIDKLEDIYNKNYQYIDFSMLSLDEIYRYYTFKSNSLKNNNILENINTILKIYNDIGINKFEQLINIDGINNNNIFNNIHLIILSTSLKIDIKDINNIYKLIYKYNKELAIDIINDINNEYINKFSKKIIKNISNDININNINSFKSLYNIVISNIYSNLTIKKQNLVAEKTIDLVNYYIINSSVNKVLKKQIQNSNVSDINRYKLLKIYKKQIEKLKNNISIKDI